MIRSTGTNGSTFPASLPARRIAERIAARSTTAGTPVKSCMRTRAGRNGSSLSGDGAGHFASAAMFSSPDVPAWASRMSPSRRTFTVIGRPSPRPFTG